MTGWFGGSDVCLFKIMILIGIWMDLNSDFDWNRNEAH